MTNVVTDLLGKKVTITVNKYSRDEAVRTSTMSGVVRAVAHSRDGYSLIVQDTSGEKSRLVITGIGSGVEVVVEKDDQPPKYSVMQREILDGMLGDGQEHGWLQSNDDADALRLLAADGLVSCFVTAAGDQFFLTVAGRDVAMAIRAGALR